MRRAASLRRRLLAWFEANARNLPWRATRDPYRIWLSEIMLQQTRVAAVIPYYERFLKRFPNVAALARAPEEQVLTAWSGLGYYSRARNLYRAAKEIAGLGTFPNDYESLRRLPGVGAYTAAAVASIAFGLPHPVVDSNVRRVVSRLSCGAVRPEILAEELLDRKLPGDFNQALMELGATVCLPHAPLCTQCPLGTWCEARRLGRETEFPRRAPRPATISVRKTLLAIERRGALLFRRHGGFWELPEEGELPAELGLELGAFRHSITNHRYVIGVRAATATGAPRAYRWIKPREMKDLPLSTMARKALAIWVRRTSPRGH